MEIQIISTAPINSSLDSTREFGVMLTKILSVIRMVHWYAADYNSHVILGELYESLENLFDKLQEEIIGTSKLQDQQFPSFGPTSLDLDCIDQYRSENNNVIETYNKVYQITVDVLSSQEFSAYISNVQSGINNTKEDILSSFNKANYLLSLVKL